MTTDGRRTSVPDYGGEPAAVDPAARTLDLIGISDAAEPILARWRAAAEVPVWATLRPVADADLVATLDARLAQARVGWRLMLAGPQDDVTVLRARALTAGAVPAEITAATTSVERQRVYCVHCTTVTRTGQLTEPGLRADADLTCPGCGRGLQIREHFSARLAAYLGVARVR